MQRELAQLGEQVAAPDLWDDQANAQRVTGRLSALQGDLERYTGLKARLDDLETLAELAGEEGDADALAEAEADLQDRKSAVSGKGVDLGGRRIIKKKNRPTCDERAPI